MNLRDVLTASAATVALLGASGAQAEGTYLSLFGGLSTFDDEVNMQTSVFNPGITIPGHYNGTAVLAASTPITFALTTPIVTTRTIGYLKTLVGVRYDSTQIYHSSYWNLEDDFDNGFVVGAALGTSFSDGFRGELELSYRASDVDSGGRVSRRINGTIRQNIYFPTVTADVYRYLIFNTFLTTFVPYTGTFASGLPVSSGSASLTLKVATGVNIGSINGPTIYLPNASTAQGTFTSSGEVQVWSLMANVWYDFDFMGMNPEGITTFVGGGIGVADLSLELDATMGTYFGGTRGYSIDDSSMGFAYQMGAGIGFELGEGMMLSAQYRWFGTSDVDVGNTDMRVESHNAIISLSVPLGNLMP